MRQLVTLLLSTLLFHSAYAQQPNYLPEQKLKGKVKTLQEYTLTTDATISPAKESLALTHLVKYNKQGLKVEEYKPSMMLGIVDTENKYTYSYNSKGAMTEMSISSKGDTFRQKIINTYDKKGRLLKADMVLQQDKTSIKTTLHYDTRGNVTDILRNNDGIRNKYNERGNLIERCNIEAGKETEIGKTTFVYNNKDQIIEQRTEKMIILYQYEDFDKAGNWQKVSASYGNAKFRPAVITPFNVTVRKITYY